MSRWTLLILFLAALAGCKTMTSTMLNRTDNDMFVGNSDGEPGLHCDAEPFDGIPITIKVPTHFDVAILETYYLAAHDNRLVELSMNHRSFDVDAKIVETEKLFTVDFPRPASGTLAYNLDMDPESQYFKQIKNEITDNTIKDVAAAIGKVAPAIAKLTSAGKAKLSDDLKKNLIVESRTVAWKRFDIDSPDFEEQVRCFVEVHINQCNTCRTNMAPAVP